MDIDKLEGNVDIDTRTRIARRDATRKWRLDTIARAVITGFRLCSNNCVNPESSIVLSFTGNNKVCDDCLRKRNARYVKAKLSIPLPIPSTIPWQSPSSRHSPLADGKPFAWRRAPKATTPAHKHAAPLAPNTNVRYIRFSL